MLKSLAVIAFIFLSTALPSLADPMTFDVSGAYQVGCQDSPPCFTGPMTGTILADPVTDQYTSGSISFGSYFTYNILWSQTDTTLTLMEPSLVAGAMIDCGTPSCHNILYLVMDRTIEDLLVHGNGSIIYGIGLQRDGSGYWIQVLSGTLVDPPSLTPVPLPPSLSLFILLLGGLLVYCLAQRRGECVKSVQNVL